MAKGPLYITARAPARTSNADINRACEVFISAGRYRGTPTVVAEVANYCLDRGIDFSLVGDGPTINRV